MITQRLAAVGQRFRNINPRAVEIGRGTFRDLSYRSDVFWVPSPAITIEAGGQGQHLRSSRTLLEYNGTPTGVVVAQRTDDFDESARVASGFMHGSFAAGRLSIAPGVRVAHSSMVDEKGLAPPGAVSPGALQLNATVITENASSHRHHLKGFPRSCMVPIGDDRPVRFDTEILPMMRAQRDTAGDRPAATEHHGLIPRVVQHNPIVPDLEPLDHRGVRAARIGLPDPEFRRASR